MPLSIKAEVAPVMFHRRVADCPRYMLVGLTLKLTIAGGELAGFTVRVVVDVTLPVLSVATRV